MATAAAGTDEADRLGSERDQSGGGSARGTVLVVEDEALIRLAAADALRAAGFRVIEAATGAEAERIIRSAAPFDLLFTDVAIGPGPNGVKLAAMMRLALPARPVVITTAYELSTDVRLVADLYLRKPYDMAAMVAAIATLLPMRNSGTR